MLLEYRPDLESRDVDDNTALHHITSRTPVSAVKLAVNAGSKLDALNKLRQSPLMAAIENLSWDVVRYLLSKPGAIPNPLSTS